MLLQDLIYMIYNIYAYLKQFIQLGDKKQNILHMHSEKLNNAINGSMSFRQWISERKIQFCPVAPCSNDRVVFASMLQVFYSKHEQEETALLIDRRFHFVPKQYCIFLTELPT